DFFGHPQPAIAPGPVQAGGGANRVFIEGISGNAWLGGHREIFWGRTQNRLDLDWRQTCSRIFGDPWHWSPNKKSRLVRCASRINDAGGDEPEREHKEKIGKRGE